MNINNIVFTREKPKGQKSLYIYFAVEEGGEEGNQYSS